MASSSYHEGDIVKGHVTRKIKGGLLVEIGGDLNVFLPASQVDIRRPFDIADYINQEIECMILKIGTMAEISPHDYLTDHSGFAWPRLLGQLAWLLPPTMKVWVMNRFGDLFLSPPDEATVLSATWDTWLTAMPHRRV